MQKYIDSVESEVHFILKKEFGLNKPKLEYMKNSLGIIVDKTMLWVRPEGVMAYNYSVFGGSIFFDKETGSYECYNYDTEKKVTGTLEELEYEEKLQKDNDAFWGR